MLDQLSTASPTLAAELTAPPALELSQVTKRFNSARPVVDAIELRVRRGEFFSLLGPSGCGKTTTLRMVAGLERPDGGEIFLRGQPVASVPAHRFVPPEKRNLGMVFQNYAIWPHMTVFENVAYPLQLRGQSRAAIRTRVEEVLQLVGLAGFEERPATQLSGGQQQRLALCRALVYAPDLVLLDEPFSNLDARLREQMRIELKLLQQRLNVTVLFVTHDQLEALSLSDTIAVMNLGRIEQVGPPRALYEAPGSAFVRDFVGQHILLDAHVDELLGAGRARVVVDGLGATFTGHAAPGWMPTCGAMVKLAVRPEDVQLLPRRPSDMLDALPAVTQSIQFFGDRYQVSVVLASGAQLQLQAPRTLEWRTGQEVSLSWPAEAATLWPA